MLQYNNFRRRSSRNQNGNRRRRPNQSTFRPQQLRGYKTGTQREIYNNRRTILDFKPNGEEVQIFNELGRFIPDRSFVKLRIIDHQLARGSTSARVSNWFYQSSATEYETSFGALSGMTDLFNLYSKFRVHAITANITFCNPMSTPILVVVFPAAFNIAQNGATYNQLLGYATNPQARQMLLGNSSSNCKGRLTVLASARELMGVDYFRDDDSTSTQITNPVNMFFLNVGLLNTTNANMSALMPMNITLTYDVECMERRGYDD